MRPTILLLLAFLLFPVPSALADSGAYELRVYYLEFPPYYYTNIDHEPDGFLLKLAEQVFHAAEIRPVWESMPAKRILRELHFQSPVASIGWFKTPERENFARFSMPIYQNRPLEVYFLSQNEARFQAKSSLAHFLGDSTIELGMLEGYSYGSDLDDRIQYDKPRTRFLVGGFPQLMGMLGLDRFDYVFIAPEEAGTLIEEARLSAEYFSHKTLSDMPAGNHRHIMFSRGVPESVIERVDRAIKAMGIEF